MCHGLFLSLECRPDYYIKLASYVVVAHVGTFTIIKKEKIVLYGYGDSVTSSASGRRGMDSSHTWHLLPACVRYDPSGKPWSHTWHLLPRACIRTIDQGATLGTYYYYSIKDGRICIIVSFASHLRTDVYIFFKLKRGINQTYDRDLSRLRLSNINIYIDTHTSKICVSNFVKCT